MPKLNTHSYIHTYIIDHYEGWLLYFGMREQKQKINNRKSFYCFSKYSLLRSIHFCMRLKQLSKHFCHSDWLIILSDWQIVWDATLVCQNVISRYNLKNVKLCDRVLSWQIATLGVAKSRNIKGNPRIMHFDCL